MESTPAVGRGDLVRLLRAFPDVSREQIALLLGYSYEPADFDNEIKPLQLKEQDAIVPAEPLDAPPLPLTAQFWYVKEREILGLHQEDKEVPPPARSELPAITTEEGPPFSPLVPWAGLWPFLKEVLGGGLFLRELDEVKAVARIARGEPLDRFPRKRRNAWAARARVVMDIAPRLFPFWGDFNQVVHGVNACLGEGRVTVSRLRGGPFGLDYDPRTATNAEFDLRPLDMPVLILSDLGAYGEERDRNEWLRFGEVLRNQGVRPVVLAPVPKRLWDVRHANLFHRVAWDDTGPRPSLHGSQSSGQIASGDDCNVEILLTLCSTAVRVEPRLMRALRRLIPGTDVGVEGKAWTHPAVCSTYLAFSFNHGYHEKFRRNFQDSIEGSLCETALHCIQEFHSFLPPEVQLEERLAQHILKPSLVPMDEHMQAFLGWFSRDTAAMDDPDAVGKWLRRMAWRQLPEIKGIGLAKALRKKIVEVFQKEIEQGGQFPAVVDDAVVAAFRDMPVTPVSDWRIFQRGEKLVFQKWEKGSSDSAPSGSVLGNIKARELVETPNGAGTVKRVLRDGLALPLPLSGPFTISTSEMALTFDIMGKPQWAEAISRGAPRASQSPLQLEVGLFATLPLNNSIVAWAFPKDFVVRSTLNIFLDLSDSKKEHGLWVNSSELDALVNGWPDLSWSKDHGLDQYGLWAAFEYAGVRQVMRWIRPGTFMMGSPVEEAGHAGDETQHEVRLTQGYWLADTACTQELWQAVRGENPSRFTHAEQLPVERVSWEDCQQFLETLNAKLSGLNLTLPTEAQWEYACRAGTITPYSFGETITTDQVNHDGDGITGEYRGKTLPVNALPCNQRGLFQMHGNVWEWCADWLGKYPRKRVVDPMGPKQGEDRVVRGGCWIEFAWRARSACRYRYAPGLRNGSFGFRFSRGR